LIDFGICHDYMDEVGNHIPNKKAYFKGSLIFSSLNAMERQTQTRRDDLISFCYILLNLLSIEPLSDLEKKGYSLDEMFEKIKERKKSLKPTDLCKGDAKCLLPFLEEVFSYGFKQEPFYGKLRHLLTVPLLNLDKVPR
jgi:hypothetical protein